MINLPVLILAYRRLDSLKLVIEALGNQEHASIYVSSDAAKNKDGAEVKEVREYLEMKFEEGVIGHLNFRSENLGIAKAVMEGIDWFFQEEEAGIIIEDDIILREGAILKIRDLVPLLSKNPDLFSINLRNDIPESEIANAANLARISRLVSSHGWITSASKWHGFRLNYRNLSVRDMSLGIPNNFGIFAKKAFVEYFKRNRRREFKLNHSWDVYWQAYVFSKNGHTINLNENLVNYIGYDEFATHHKAQPRAKDNRIISSRAASNRIIGEWDTRADKYRFRIGMRNTLPRYLVRRFRIDSVLKNKWNL